MRYLLMAIIANAVLSTSANAQQAVSVLEQDSRQYLLCEELATALDMEFKLVNEGKLATFCSSGAAPLCIPVQLNATNHRTVSSKVYLLLSEARTLLTVEVTVDGDKATVTKSPPSLETQSALNSGYNSPWPAGRGFEVGQTVPDIPLVDMDGNEVRFSEYLGKRYILYCWASW